MLDVLGEAALRTLVLAAVVNCGLRLLRVRQPQLLLAAWTVVLATSTAMPMLARLAPLRVSVAPVFPIMLIDDASDAFANRAVLVRSTDVPFEERPERSLRWWLETGYVVVAAAIAFRVLLGVALSLRLLAQSVPIHAEWVAGTRARISRDVATPVTVAHTILLPADAESWSPEMRAAVLAHERAHVARWDYAMLVLAQLNRALFWFNPLSWWLHRRLVVLSELASDDQALAITRDPLGYAEILLEMGRRSGPVLRGPAMARLSTLASRIDRILDEPAYQRVDPSVRVMITAVVAGLSVAAASLAPDPVRDSGIPPLPRLITTGVAALDPRSQAVTGADLNEPSINTEQTFVSREPSTTTPPSLNAGSEVVPLLRWHDVQQIAAPPPTISLQQPPLLSSIRAVPYLTPPLPPRPSIPSHGRRARENEKPRVQPNEAKEVLAPKALDADADIWRSSRADKGIPLSLPLESTRATPLSQRSLEFDEIMRSTCTGTIAVGLRARQYTQPNVVAGQTVKAEAQFFRRKDGASWVRFSAFGRPPLDLPVHFTQGRVTWIGEYGIAYAVQSLGGGRLAGLAAQVAFDSAQLEFICKKA